MPLLLNGINIENVLLNGQQLEELQINNSIVWTRKAPSVDVPSGTVVFQSSTAGQSQFTIEDEGTYNVRIVGAGGGGAAWLYRWGSFANQWRASVAAGGSGGYYYAAVLLTPGIYSVNVGKGGAGTYSMVNSNATQKPSAPASASASAGGSSSVSGPSGEWICGGGTGGSCGNGFATAGIGGSGLTSNGNKGGSYFTNAGVTATSSYIDIYATGGGAKYSSYGKGGNADSEYYSSGPSWLVKGAGGNNGFIEVVKA
jgi:hypothetical protein